MTVKLTILLLAGAVLASPIGFVQAAKAQTETDKIAAPPSDFTFVGVGDLLGPYEPSANLANADLNKVLKIVRDADVAFANQEGTSFDTEGFAGFMAAENGGGYPVHTLSVTRSFRDMGFDMISRANNHATDWGVEGMAATDHAMDAIGLAHAGTGKSLDAARAPAFFQTDRGRVALVAAASTFTGMSPAGDPGRGAGARPGLNPMHVTPITLVDRQEFETLTKIVRRGGWQGYDEPKPGDTELHLNEQTYRLSDQPGLTYEVSEKDQSELVESIRMARKHAGLVAFSIHAHETLSGAYDDPSPPAFLSRLFHSVIDAGADIVFRHGPHTPLGIEIYKGKPIFYGLGGFFFDIKQTLVVAGEGPEATRQKVEVPLSWYEGAVAHTRFKDGKLAEIRIYPLLLEPRESMDRGYPRFASGAAALRILSKIQSESEKFGTKLHIRDGIGVIVVP